MIPFTEYQNKELNPINKKVPTIKMNIEVIVKVLFDILVVSIIEIVLFDFDYSTNIKQ